MVSGRSPKSPVGNERLRAPLACLLLAGLLTAWPGCESRETESARDEPQAALGLVKLSAEAREAIGLVVEPAAREHVQDAVAATGWIVARPASEVIVKAPVAGFVAAAAGQAPPELGDAVPGDGRALAEIRVVLSAQDEAALVAAKEEADTVIRQSKTTLDMAEAQLRRAKQAEGAVAGTRLAELEETVERARAAYEEAQQKLPFLPQEPFENPLRVKPVPIDSPMAGRVIAVHVRPGQFASAGDPLWTVADWSSLWVRVPVFELDLARIDAGKPAEIDIPGSRKTLSAHPVDAPQPTAPGQRTVDRFYELANPSGELRPGQAVAVRLPTATTGQQVVVPREAVLWDGLGNTWVYVEAGGAFRRQKVELGPAAGGQVVVARGLDEGARVVTAGAEALYGEEFKSQIPVEEEGEGD